MTREEAILLLHDMKDTYDEIHENTNYEIGYEQMTALDMAIEALQEVQKHEETFEWCHDCKEYDKDNYCCHRWSKVIRNTVEELKADTVSREEYNNLLRTKISFANATIPTFTESEEAYKAWTGEEMGGTSDLICRSDALEQMAQAECGLHYDDCEAYNCSCSYIQRILDIQSADAVSREFYEDAVKANIGLVIKNRELKEQIELADAVPQLKQTDTLIIADALRYLAQDTERHLVDRTRADALRQQFLKYGASMCKGGDSE